MQSEPALASQSILEDTQRTRIKHQYTDSLCRIRRVYIDVRVGEDLVRNVKTTTTAHRAKLVFVHNNNQKTHRAERGVRWRPEA